MKAQLTIILYTTVLYLLVPMELLRMYWRGRVAPAYRLRWLERFAINLPAIKKQGIWVHTASVGELFATLPVIKFLLKNYPDMPITVTTMTATGSEQVKIELGDTVNHLYVPFDLPDAVSRFLTHVAPQKLLIMETELWPNIISGAYQRGVDIVLMNARLSARSAKGYGYVKSVTRSILRKITIIAAQHEDDAKRFIALGAKEESIKITGNIKYDLNLNQAIVEQGKSLRTQFPSDLVWIAASTHRGEDEQVLEAHRLVQKRFPDAQLIIVPRHPERFNEVADICKDFEFSYTRRSLSQGTKEQVYLGDTMGELLILFSVADMAFVGGSLVETGGHNLLEPAALAKPVLTGPYDFNFLDINRQMLQANAAVCINNADQLAHQIIAWQDNKDVMKQVGENALAVVKNNQGALKKLLSLIENQQPAA